MLTYEPFLLNDDNHHDYKGLDNPDADLSILVDNFPPEPLNCQL